MNETSLFDFSKLPSPKRKGVVDDVRNILIVEFPGDKEGEMQLKKLYEELRDRGLTCKIMN